MNRAALEASIAAIERDMASHGGSFAEALLSVQRSTHPIRSTKRPPPAKPDLLADRKAQQKLELDEIRAGLHSNVESLVLMLLGEKPTSRTGTDWRFGARGALKVTVRGPKQGLFHDKSDDRGGDMLVLIMRQRGLSFVDALAWARDYLGLPVPDHAKELTAAERAAMQAHAAAREAHRAREAAEAEAQQRLRHETVARRAAIAWAGSRLAPADHPYLVAKGIQQHGMRLDRRGRLRLPMQDATGKIWSLQHIQQFADGTNVKRFLRRGRADGMFAALGPTNAGDILLFAEGFATAATLREATGRPVVVTFSVGNKDKVMRAWRAREPHRVLVDAADNDHAKPRRDPPAPNAGADMAARLVKAIGAVQALPPFRPDEVGSDWNDFARLHGLGAVRGAVSEALRLS